MKAVNVYFAAITTPWDHLVRSHYSSYQNLESTYSLYFLCFTLSQFIIVKFFIKYFMILKEKKTVSYNNNNNNVMYIFTKLDFCCRWVIFSHECKFSWNDWSLSSKYQSIMNSNLTNHQLQLLLISLWMCNVCVTFKI